MANDILPNCNYVLSIAVNEVEKHEGLLIRVIQITQFSWFTNYLMSNLKKKHP